jgi:hypothetical protein
MSGHLSSQQIEEWVIGERTRLMEEHVLACQSCAEEVQRVVGSMQLFREAVREWSAETPPLQFKVPPRTVRWRFAVLVAALLMVIAVPVYRRNEFKRQAAVTSAAVTSAQDEILLRRVETGLSRSVPAPMEPLENLMSN